MTRLLIGALILALCAALAVGIAISQHKPIREVYRREGDRLIVVSQALAVVIILLALAVLVAVNN